MALIAKMQAMVAGLHNQAADSRANSSNDRKNPAQRAAPIESVGGLATPVGRGLGVQRTERCPTNALMQEISLF